MTARSGAAALEERRGARRRAPVMRRQHHPHAGRPDEPSNAGFGGRLDVAGQEQRHARRTAPRPPPSRRSSRAGVPTRAVRDSTRSLPPPRSERGRRAEPAPRCTGCPPPGRAAAAGVQAGPAPLPRPREDGSRPRLTPRRRRNRHRRAWPRGASAERHLPPTRPARRRAARRRIALRPILLRRRAWRGRTGTAPAWPLPAPRQ